MISLTTAAMQCAKKQDSFYHAVRVAGACCVLVAISFSAQANDGCGAQSPMIAANECSFEHYLKADKALNQTWQTLLKQLNPQQAKSARAAQRLWIQFRDQHCALVRASADGGSAAPLITNECLQNLTEQRIAQLNDLKNLFQN